MQHNKYTLEEIEASWLGHGPSIPIGEMVAWLINEVEDLRELDFQSARAHNANLMEMASLREAISHRNENITALREEVSKLKDQISMYVKNGAEAVHELEQENAELKQKLTEAREINRFYGNTKYFWPCTACGAMNQVKPK